jgi:hypothetical protein
MHISRANILHSPPIGRPCLQNCRLYVAAIEGGLSCHEETLRPCRLSLHLYPQWYEGAAGDAQGHITILFSGQEIQYAFYLLHIDYIQIAVAKISA